MNAQIVTLHFGDHPVRACTTPEGPYRYGCGVGDMPCFICGQYVRTDRPHNQVHVIHGGALLASKATTGPALAALEADAGEMGWHPVGPRCSRKIPAEFRSRFTPEEA